MIRRQNTCRQDTICRNGVGARSRCAISRRTARDWPRMADDMGRADSLDGPFVDYTEAKLLAFLDRYQLTRDIGSQWQYKEQLYGCLAVDDCELTSGHPVRQGGTSEASHSDYHFWDVSKSLNRGSL